MKLRFALFCFASAEAARRSESMGSCSCAIPWSLVIGGVLIPFQALTGTLAVRSSLPQLTHAPLTARRIAFQMQ
jgi:hypothetical protein